MAPHVYCAGDMNVTTFLGATGKLFVAKQERADLKSETGIFPTFIGIGGPKSGSTSMVLRLSEHLNIEIGESTRGGQTCCGPELYVMINGALEAEGLSTYKKFYPDKIGGEIKQIGEKTPSYSEDPLVPYKVKALLGDDTKVLYTIRDMIDMDVSHYFHSKEYGRMDTKDMTYWEWVDRRVNAQSRFLKCRENHFQMMVVPDGAMSKEWFIKLEDLYTTDMLHPKDVQMIENYLTHRCTAGSDPNIVEHVDRSYLPLRDIPDMGGLTHSVNLKRWRHVVGADNFMCITDRDQFCDTEGTAYKVLRFLGVDATPPDGYPAPNPVRIEEEIYNKTVTAGKLRLQKFYEVKFPDKMHEIDKALEFLRDFLKRTEDTDFVSSVCPGHDEFCY